MKTQNRQSFIWSFILLVLLTTSLLYPGPIVKAGATAQNPGQAESYRRLAAAKRKAAENVPAKRDCYNAWANYYDCLALKYEKGDNRDCGKEPPAC